MEETNWFLEVAKDNGVIGVIAAVAFWYYHTVVRPRTIAREDAREKNEQERRLADDASHADQIREMVEISRQERKENNDREMLLRQEHAAQWELQRQQYREERELDRALYREIIAQFEKLADRLMIGQDRNFAATLAVGETVSGQGKGHLIRRTEAITRRKVDDQFKENDTQHPDE
jgi:hypothetical protein